MTTVQTPPASLGLPLPAGRNVPVAKLGEEQTFRSYSEEDAANYAKLRLQYSDDLYQMITSYHTSTEDSKLGTVVDVGCGPGVASFQLAEYFETVIGVDPSEGMINTARSRLAASGGEKDAKNVRFELSTAEDIDPALIPDASVDVITAATCAHWFDMTRFWPTAARILRPGGTVAIWGGRPATAHWSVPNADKINAAWEEMKRKDLAPYANPGTMIARSRYQDLGLPWTVAPPVPDFDQGTFHKKLFGTEDDRDTPFFAVESSSAFDLDTMEKRLSTLSLITRWRQDHPEAVGTEDDIARRTRRLMEKYLHEAGVVEGQEQVRAGTLGVLLMVKKRSA